MRNGTREPHDWLTGSNALASSIVLVCRPRPENAATTSRRAFQRELNTVLPEALDEMTKRFRRRSFTCGSGGPFSGHHRAGHGSLLQIQRRAGGRRIADGRLSALPSTHQPLPRGGRFRHRHPVLPSLVRAARLGRRVNSGDADTLARAKGTSVDGVKHAGVLYASGGIVRLLKWNEYLARIMHGGLANVV